MVVATFIGAGEEFGLLCDGDARLSDVIKHFCSGTIFKSIQVQAHWPM